ncbi:MAG: DUF262 domain-containing protein [Planctomycetaceae bacterium]|jgi:hypothetical protein|nr:DUF262 domain-containing protein [Planctomycetaceae bacterium]
MKIELHKITVRDLTAGYTDNQEAGVAGYSGRLNIRPPYQREFVYGEKERNAVIKTVMKGFPLNVMYWVKNGDNYEVLDGQQRTISICQYVNETFSIDDFYFQNLQDKKEAILNYELTVYFCEGTDDEKLEWFHTVNIAGKPLNEQEIRNSVYTGSWLSAAKLKFSKTGCAAFGHGKNYVKGSPINQDFLQTALHWISDGNIKEYMGRHQRDSDAEELWQYYCAVIVWVQTMFPNYRKEIQGINWGELYNRHRETVFDTAVLECRIAELMEDEDVTNKKGIYEYVLTGAERCLNVRVFSDKHKREAYERQSGVCPHCKQSFAADKMEGDHITPWSQGGKTVTENCQMLCKDCNRRKAGN